MKRIGLFTSGGDAPGMNACIRAVTRTALSHGLEVVGIRRGYQGMIEGDFELMDGNSVSNIIQSGGTILHSSRSKEFRTEEGRQKAYLQLKKVGIDALIAIGGDGTFTGAHVFMQEFDFPVIGIPGTIDNDLYGTDYTIGYDTARNTALNAIDKIRDTANSHNRVFFIEVMGRDSGFIALSSGIAGGAEAIILPELKHDQEWFIKRIEEGWSHPKTSMIVVVAEGEEDGGAMGLADRIHKRFPHLECRVTILGHLQRGGNPTCLDRVLASRLGVHAVKALLDGKRDVMAGLIHRAVQFTPFTEVVSKKREISGNIFGIIDILAY